MYSVINQHNKLAQTTNVDDSIRYRNMQLRFSICGDPLFKMEESRWLELNRRRELVDVVGRSNINAEYSLDIDFQNIKSFTWRRDQSGYVAPGNIKVLFMVQLEKPCGSRKKNFLTFHGQKLYEQKFKKRFFSFQSNCRSPLNLGTSDTNLFLNFWNLNQTFYL